MSINKKLLIGAAIGNSLEALEFMLIAVLATKIGTTFFSPSGDKLHDLLNVFYVVFAGYLARPIGAFFFGVLSDSSSRRKSLLYTFTLMAFSTTAIGLIPSYNSIGILSTILFVCARFLQGLSLGNELPNSIAYLIENMNNRNGFAGSFAMAGFNAGGALAFLLAACVFYSINIHLIPEWSWRMLFATALLIFFFGYWFRKNLPESLEYILNMDFKGQAKFELQQDLKTFVKYNKSLCLFLCLIVMFGTAQTSMAFFVAPNIFLSSAAGGSDKLIEIFLCTGFSLLLVAVLIPYFGHISDRFGRTRLLLIAGLAHCFITPMIFNAATSGNLVNLQILLAISAIPSALFYVSAMVLLTESFSIKIRATLSGLIYAGFGSTVSGLTPIFSINATMNGLNPGLILPCLFILMVICCIARKASIACSPGAEERA